MTIKRALTIGVSALAMLAAAAQANAADMGSAPSTGGYGPAYASENWTGFYLGVNGGYSWDHAKASLSAANGAQWNYYTDQTQIPAVNALGSADFNGSTGIVGGKIGYNQQLGNYVIGLEADYSHLGLSRSRAATGSIEAPWYATFNETASSDWLFTVRPRLGVAYDRFFPYVTGGLAVGNVRFGYSEHELAPGGASYGNASASRSDTKAGWTVGGGINYALTSNWIVNAEYLHADLGTIDVSGTVTSENPATATHNFSTSFVYDTVRGGINYKF